MSSISEKGAHGQNHALPLEYSTETGRLNILGFWIFLATDLILFSCLFATYIILSHHTDGGPTGKQLFEVKGFMIETVALLASSFTGSLSIFAMRNNNKSRTVGWMIVTLLLGIVFVGYEISEFVHYASIGATMQRSAFLSGFFTLVGTHGCHVTLGIFWMFSILTQVIRFGITPATARKAFIVGIYWHFLDIVWIFIFTVVYMTGVIS